MDKTLSGGNEYEFIAGSGCLNFEYIFQGTVRVDIKMGGGGGTYKSTICLFLQLGRVLTCKHLHLCSCSIGTKKLVFF